MIARAAFLLAALLAPSGAAAQAVSCRVPAAIPRPRPDLPSASQPVRRLPIGSYTLAVSWSPEHCRTRGDRPDSRFQCGDDRGGGNRFGFVLHGLWPDGVGKDWPQYCRPTGLLPRKVLADNLCATPSVQLLQHEWAKHGTCMAGTSPQRYFGRARSLYDRLHFPDMDRLSRDPSLTAGRLAQAIAAANPGMRADTMRITATRAGWLDEVWLCLDRAFRPTRCPAHQGGVSPGTALKIWRGRR